jgi:hypothetical protein
MVYGSMPDRVIAEQHSSPFSLHYPKWEVCAARFPASRGALLSNAHDAQALRLSITGDSRFGMGRLSTRRRRPTARAPIPHLPAPARVTGGRYTAQLSVKVQTRHYIHALHFRCNPYGCCLPLVDGSHAPPPV